MRNSYYINLIYDLDPNSANIAGPVIQWPRWSNSTPSLVNFGASSNSIIQDNFRQGKSLIITNLSYVEYW